MSVADRPDEPDEPDEPEAPDGPVPERPLPLQVTMGLLDRVAAGALDEDYALVARRRLAQAQPESSEGAPRRRTVSRVSIGSAVVLGLFTLLLTVAGIQTAREQPVREAERASLTSEVSDRRTALDDTRERLVETRREVSRLSEEQLSSTQQGRALQARMSLLGGAVGATAVTGPGMVVTVDDAPDPQSDRQRVLDGDLQRLVNGLWEAGAEAIAINDQRLTQLSAIRTAGDAIHVNFKPLRPPYVVSVIGDPDQLPARFVDTEGGAWWLNLRSVYEVRFEMSSRDELTLPGAGIEDLRSVRVQDGAS